MLHIITAVPDEIRYGFLIAAIRRQSGKKITLNVAVMIPKTIHYVWLSGEQKPPMIQRCIESWRRLMPDYEITEWDMARVRREVASHPWLDSAIEKRIWAFATDYLRLWILYHYGGIYLDSDVRAIKRFDPYLVHRGFSGIEYSQGGVNPDDPRSGINIEAAVIGSEKEHPFIGACLEEYGRRELDPERLETQTIPILMSRLAEPYGFRYDHTAHQILDGDFHIYPYDYFSTQCGIVRDIVFSENTVTIHLCAGSWLGERHKNNRKHHPFTSLRIHTKEYFRLLGNEISWIFSPRRRELAKSLRQVTKNQKLRA